MFLYLFYLFWPGACFMVENCETHGAVWSALTKGVPEIKKKQETAKY